MRRKRSETHPAAGSPRPSRRIHEPAPGRSEKLPELTACPDCGASYRNGRWTWRTAPADAHQQVCPACERIAEQYPAGVLHVEGAFARAHREDLIGMLRNIEERERSEHPLKRIMGIEETDAGFVVSVTDPKLARTFGRSLQKAHEGRLEAPPTTSERENLVRVHWTRD